MRLIIAAVFVCASAGAFSPALASEDDQIWPTTNVDVSLGDGFKASNETVVRIGDARGLYEVENNFMIGKKLGDVTLWLGYTHDPNYVQGSPRFIERRFRQQINFDNILAVGKLKVSGRIRMEERWRDGVSGTAYRLRPQVKLAYPITADGKTSLIASHESFIDLNTPSFQTVAGEERMRNYVGVSRQVAKHLKIEGGYLNQYGFAKGRASTSDNVLVISLNASF